MSRSRPTSWGSPFTRTTPTTSRIPWDELEPIPGLLYSNTERTAQAQAQEDRRSSVWLSNSSVRDSTAAGLSQSHQRTEIDIHQLYRGNLYQNLQRPASAPESADALTAVREARAVCASAYNTTPVGNRRRGGSRTRLHSTPTFRRRASPPRVMDPGRSTLANAVVSQVTSEPTELRASSTLGATAYMVTQPMDIPTEMSSRRVPWGDFYSDYNSGPKAYYYTTTDELIPDLTLDVVSDSLDSEKWDMPPGVSSNGFLGNGWKLKLVISYVSTDPTGNFDIEFEPSITIRTLGISCTLAVIPRTMPATTRRFRNYSPPFTVTYRGAELTANENGYSNEMDPTAGIHRDPFWCGPTVVGHHHHRRRMEYSMHVYVPIPISLFKATDTRVFDIEARVCVSACKLLPLELTKLQRLHFSNFVQINELDDSKRCALVG